MVSDNDSSSTDDDFNLRDSDSEDNDIFVDNLDIHEDDFDKWMGFGVRDVKDDDRDSVESESLNSMKESSDEGNECVYPKYNSMTDQGKTIEMEVGKEYPDQIIFRQQLRQYALAKGFDYKLVKNEKSRVSAVCKLNETCKWKIYASWNTDETAFVIKTFNSKHECGAQFYNSKVSAKWISSTFFENIKESPNISTLGLQTLVRRTYNVYATQQQCYRGKKMALSRIYGDELRQYEKLGEYIEAVKLFNPGSRALIKTDGLGYFLRIYICLDACRQGFMRGCRPFIGLDACHLKVYQQGQLFAAVSCDANDNIFPIAYAVCEIENTETWRWFIEQLAIDIGIQKARQCTFISDQQKGLDRALMEEVDGVDHRFCVRHLYNNYKKSFKGSKLKQLMWESATATTRAKFDFKMSELKEICPEAAAWLLKIDVKQWARHAFNEKVRCAMLLNNLCESFNAFVKEARDKPILVMLETIRRKLMERFNVKMRGIHNYRHTICPRIMKIVEKVRLHEREYITRLCGDGEFEVEHMYGEVHVVKLQVMECTCRRWQLTGIPCTHSCAAIVANKQNPNDYVYNCYTKATFLAIYEQRIRGIPGAESWPVSTVGPIKPPIRKRQPGRPKKNRNREEGEGKSHDPTKFRRTNTRLRCGRCQEWGHNVRTCKGQPKPKRKHQKPGDNIRVIELNDGSRQAIREQDWGGSTSHLQHRVITQEKDEISESSSQLQTSQATQGSHYQPFQDGPACMPTQGVLWSGNPNPNRKINRFSLVSEAQIRRAAKKLGKR